MYILGIETSCDETAAAIVKDGREILSNVVVSQIDIFKEYGGVIPEVAARSHLEAMLPVVNKALKDANLTWEQIDKIAVTHTPGLLGSLLIGTLTARTLAILHDKPLYPVHHLKSHIYANWLTGNQPEFPLLALVVSGGHTQIIRMTKHNQFEIIGTTRDDAVGECFDKVAKILGLPYPGGPSISKAAKNGNPEKYKFPHPKLSSPLRSSIKNASSLAPSVPSPSLDFSFSGLKTAVLREVQKAVNKPISYPSHELKNLLTEQQVADFAASFENTATDILIENLKRALEKCPDTKSICLAGGVSANELLRKKTARAFSNVSAVFFPSANLSGDNAAMVAAAAFYEIESGVPPTDPYKVSLAPRSPIDK
ncbi:tRNA (adenosine(37)-N6)-threonylcarbamoyltransferase complex transferase subunit TsaD [Candidatus Saccharibacteria bacterium]|nr:tRNA (adenosine(37)-N6)-threonylcarbamoyltransferase complex transferase subunit TsaD [Candidatus Saccharibacteria bacterium]